MADLSPIQNLLDDIKNAIYGEQVRTAIHDSIARCYTDVDDSKTIAANAADQATNAAASANLATNAANNAASNANAATSSANEATNNANSASEQVVATIERANKAISDAETATSNANVVIEESTSALSLVSRATASANTAASNATTAATSANKATEDASAASLAAQEATDDAITATNDCNNARSATVLATTSANNAANRANTAATAIEQLSVTSENVGPDASATATISSIDNHKNIHFKLKQGAPGAPYIIKGNAYPSISALESSVTSPNVGDQYNVGSEPPYTVYRWTGTTWESQGKIGMSISNLENSEVDSIWDGTEIVTDGSKYLNHRGLFYLVVNKIKSALNSKVDKVEGKALSSNDFTDSYVSLISDHSDAIAALDTLKVDKISGKSLSTNDFTDTFKNQITANQNAIGNAQLKTTAQTLRESVNELYDTVELNAADIHMRLYTSVTQLGLVAGQATISSIYSAISNGTLVAVSSNEIAASNRPSSAPYGTCIIYKAAMYRSFILWLGKGYNDGDYRMYMSEESDTDVPTGEWESILPYYNVNTDIFKNRGRFAAYGQVTGGSATLEIYVPLGKKFDLSKYDINITALDGSLRVSTGGYVGGSTSYDLLTNNPNLSVQQLNDGSVLYLTVELTDGNYWTNGSTKLTNNICFTGLVRITATVSEKT